MNLFLKIGAALTGISLVLLPQQKQSDAAHNDLVNEAFISSKRSQRTSFNCSLPSTYLFWPSGKPVTVPRRFDPPAQPWLPGHRGIDLRLPIGSTIYAPNDGVVIYANILAGRGVLSIEDQGGLRYTLEPVTSLVSVHENVQKGQAVALLEEGHVLGDSRLHFGVKCAQRDYLDPLRLLGGQIRLLPVIK